MIWHTPLLAYGTILWYDYVFGIFALQIIFTWLYNGAGASGRIVMIAHLFSNVMTATMKPLLSPGDQERYWLLQCLAALCGCQRSLTRKQSAGPLRSLGDRREATRRDRSVHPVRRLRPHPVSRAGSDLDGHRRDRRHGAGAARGTPA